MSLKNTNIFSSFLSILTSRLGVIMLLMLFMTRPIVVMSYSMISSTIQLTEEETSQEDSEEDSEEDTLKLYASIDEISLLSKVLLIKKTLIKPKCANTLSLDVFLPPPKLT